MKSRYERTADVEFDHVLCQPWRVRRSESVNFVPTECRRPNSRVVTRMDSKRLQKFAMENTALNPRSRTAYGFEFYRDTESSRSPPKAVDAFCRR